MQTDTSVMTKKDRNKYLRENTYVCSVCLKEKRLYSFHDDQKLTLGTVCRICKNREFKQKQLSEMIQLLLDNLTFDDIK